MFERFSWLLISDLHLRATTDQWSQNVALREMVRDIEEKRDRRPRFVIVSGDLAFSGADKEYLLVEKFLDELRAAVGLERHQVYTVPGNHDIDRHVQSTCFAGARSLLRSSEAVEEFLGKEEERKTLLKRLRGYFAFDEKYTSGQARRVTGDGLGYVSPVDIDGFPIAILALNSAWLCGDNFDKGNILVGERPIIDSIELLRDVPARLVLGVYHHPPDWLHEFDQTALEDRLLTQCDVVHRGHLHEPGVKLVSMRPDRACVTVAAGAGFAGRHFVNSYSFVTVDLARSVCEVEAFGYETHRGKFSPAASQTYPIRLRGDLPGSAGATAASIGALSPATGRHAPFLTSVLRGLVSDIPIKVGKRVVFAAPALLAEADKQFAETTQRFLEVRNLLLAFREGVGVEERIQAVRVRIEAYANELEECTKIDSEFKAELTRRSVMCSAFLDAPQPSSRAHTTSLLEELQASGDWEMLEASSRRHADSNDAELSLRARRCLAVALANQGDAEKLTEASRVASDIVQSNSAGPSDFVLAATILHNDKQDGEAAKILKAMGGRFPDHMTLAREIGQRVVVATGDADLRALLKLGTTAGGANK